MTVTLRVVGRADGDAVGDEDPASDRGGVAAGLRPRGLSAAGRKAGQHHQVDRGDRHRRHDGLARRQVGMAGGGGRGGVGWGGVGSGGEGRGVEGRGGEGRSGAARDG